MSTKIEVVLGKTVPGKWSVLEKAEALQTESSMSANPPAAMASYPTSSRAGPKNWDKVATDLTKNKEKPKNSGSLEKQSEEKDADDEYDSEYGGDPVDAFFKKLYAGSDPDTQRAMMKSYYESNGTALSTNWDEVRQRRVEPKEPSDDA